MPSPLTPIRQPTEQNFRSLAELLPQIVWTSDKEGQIDYINQRWGDYTGSTTEASLANGWVSAIHPLDLDQLNKRWTESLKKGTALEIECRFLRHDGSYRWHLIRSIPLHNVNKKVVKWIGTATDIDDQKRNEQAQRFLSMASETLASSLNYETTLASVAQLAVPSIADWCTIHIVTPDSPTHRIAAAHTDPEKTKLALELERRFPTDPNSSTGVAEVIRTGKPILVNDITESMLTATVSEPEILKILKELDLRSSLMVPLIGSKQVLGVITLILAESGRRYTEEDLGMAQELAHRASLAIENARLYEEAQQELKERKQAEKVILHQALHDALTGLPNRVLLQDRLATGLTRAKRKGEEIAIIFLDLDRFKNINDTLGHQTGDKLLQQVAKRLSSAVRSQDTVARFGGDEFTILLTGLNQKKEIKKLADKIFTALQEPITIDDHELHVNISMGIAIYPLHGKTEDVLLKNADIALYHAKDQGRNNYCIYDPGLTLKASERLQVEQELRNGLARGEFHIHYQPVLDLKSDTIVGAEALLRWLHPQRGLLMPGDFIEHAEESGLILPLGEWAITHVCEQLAQWHKQGLPPFKVALNFSTLQFSHTESFQKLHASIQKHHLHSSQLEVEITESLAMQSLETTIPRLEQIKKMGVRVAIDDFGIGHSSLSYLKLLPIDTIKIDKSFVECCTSDKYDAAIIQAVIAMARSLDIRVIAEGVETKEQLRFLRKSRCQEVQGHHISHALPEQDFIEFMREYPKR